MREARWERGHVPWCGSISRSVTHFLTGITDFKSHDLNLEYCTISINLTPPVTHDRQNEIVVLAPSQNCRDMCQKNFGSGAPQAKKFYI